MNRDLHLKMLLNDVKLATLSFKTDDFKLMNIMGNRIMSDSTFGPNVEFSLLGFFIKQIAMRYLYVKPHLSDTDFTEAKSAGQKFMESTSTFSKNAQDKSWADFHAFIVDMNKIGFSEIEKDTYQEDLQVTEAARQHLVQLLNLNRDVLTDPRSLFLKNLLVEFGRIHRVHGVGLLDTITVCALIALDRYYDYFCFRYAAPNGELNRELVEKEVYPYIDTIINIQSPPHYDIIGDFFSDLVKRWRESFIFYGELSRGAPQAEEKPLKLPEESKKKLEEVLGKALQKELKP